MDSREYREHTRRTWHRELPAREQLSNAALGLAGEAGEVADYVKKFLYHEQTPDLTRAMHELGDVLYYLDRVAELFGLTLDDIQAANVAKLQARHPNGFDPSYHANDKR